MSYLITPARLSHDDGREVVEQVAELVAALRPRGVRVRAILATDELTDEAIRRTCRDLAAAGVWMVQGGSGRGHRSGLHQIETIRAALPADVMVKWTSPVRSVSTLLLCLSLGVDRFNCDVEQILGDASRAEWLAPLTIPLAGVDY